MGYKAYAVAYAFAYAVAYAFAYAVAYAVAYANTYAFALAIVALAVVPCAVPYAVAYDFSSIFVLLHMPYPAAHMPYLAARTESLFSLFFSSPLDSWEQINPKNQCCFDINQRCNCTHYTYLP